MEQKEQNTNEKTVIKTKIYQMFEHYLLQLSKKYLSRSNSQDLPYSILFYPTSLDFEKPAIIYLHDWNNYSYTASSCFLGKALAKEGYIFLSLGISRRGVEGQMRATPEDDLDDINLGIQYFKTHGCNNIILIGEGIGALSAVRYQSKKNEHCLQGIVIIRPFTDLANWLKNKIGERKYQALLDKSETELIQGSEGELWVDMTVEYIEQKSLLIYQSFESWLSWWSPEADTKISNFLPYISTPILVISPLEAIPTKTRNTKIINLENNESLERVIHNWISELPALNSDKFQLIKTEMIPVSGIVTVKTSDHHSLIGLLWEDDNCRENKTIILHVRGKTGTPITEPLTYQFAEIYTQNQIATLVIELHRSGYGGSLESSAEIDLEDIHAFVELLLKRGYNRIILSGQSLGSNSIMRYCVQYRHPNVMAMVHFAPTQDGANWLENHLGSETYNRLVQQAKKAVENNQGNQGLIGKPPYDKMLSPHRPDAWLSWWGPEADTANLKTISEVTIPILMLCGSQDFFNDRERLDTLKEAATRSPIIDIIWYEGCGHNFANFEKQAANDVVNWLNKL